MGLRIVAAGNPCTGAVAQQPKARLPDVMQGVAEESEINASAAQGYRVSSMALSNYSVV